MSSFTLPLRSPPSEAPSPPQKINQAIQVLQEKLQSSTTGSIELNNQQASALLEILAQAQQDLKYKRLGDYGAALYNDFLGPRHAIPTILDKSASALVTALEYADEKSRTDVIPQILQEAQRHLRALPQSSVKIDKDLLFFGLKEYGTRNTDFHSGILGYRKAPAETLKMIEQDLREVPLLLAGVPHKESENEKACWTTIIECFRSSRFFFDAETSEWALKDIEDRKPTFPETMKDIIDHIKDSPPIILDTASDAVQVNVGPEMAFNTLFPYGETMFMPKETSLLELGSGRRNTISSPSPTKGTKRKLEETDKESAADADDPKRKKICIRDEDQASAEVEATVIMWNEIRTMVSKVIVVWPDEILAPFSTFKSTIRKLDRDRPAKFSYSRQRKEEEKLKRLKGERHEKVKNDAPDVEIGGLFGDED